MIDTVKVKFTMSLCEQELSGWVETITKTSDGYTKVKYTYRQYVYPNPDGEGIQVDWVYRPVDYTGKPLLIVEFSLPKVVFGNNYTLILDIPGAIQKATERITSDPYAPKVNLADGILLRADFCWIYQVGDYMPYYLETLRKLTYPRRSTKPHNGQGVVFKGKWIKTSFYDKGVECGKPEAAGMLRQETSVKSAQYLARKLGKEKPTLGDITPAIAVKILRDDLKRLGIEERPFAMKDVALETLTEKYGPAKGFRLLGMYHTVGMKADVQAISGMSPRSYNRYLADIRKAGIAPALTDNDVPLPPLRIEWEGEE